MCINLYADFFRVLKFSFSEKAKKICAIFLMLWTFTQQYQFGCGILKMAGPKKQDF